MMLRTSGVLAKPPQKKIRLMPWQLVTSWTHCTRSIIRQLSSDRAKSSRLNLPAITTTDSTITEIYWTSCYSNGSDSVYCCRRRNHSIVFFRWHQCAPPSETWFLGPTRVCSPNRLKIGSAVFAQSTRVPNAETDRQTDNATRHVHDVCIFRAVLIISWSTIFHKYKQPFLRPLYRSVCQTGLPPIKNWGIFLEQCYYLCS